ncbi:MAG: hypothetical protein ABIQ02_02295 [Saprospiraceae bacterium]
MSAQNDNFFLENFGSNIHQWKLSEKKPYFGISHNEYQIYNDEGRKPVVSIIQIPFDEEKKYRIEAEVKQTYTPAPDGGSFGIYFGGSDEKNGYAFVLDRSYNCMLLQMIDGKTTEIWRAPCKRFDAKGTFYSGDKLTLSLGQTLWYFYVNDSLAYTTAPFAWMGHTVGFYVSGMSGLEAHYLNIGETDLKAASCGVAYTSENFRKSLKTAVCALSGNLEEVLGDFDYDYNEGKYWKVKNAEFEGSSDIYIAEGGDSQKYCRGREMIVQFKCQDSKDFEIHMDQMDTFRKEINQVSPPCCELNITHTYEHLTAKLIKAIQWEGVIKNSLDELIPIMVELDLLIIGSEYSVNVHISQPVN